MPQETTPRLSASTSNAKLNFLSMERFRNDLKAVFIYNISRPGCLEYFNPGSVFFQNRYNASDLLQCIR